MARTDTAGFYYQPDVSPHSYNWFYWHNRWAKVNPYPCTPYPECTYWGWGEEPDFCEECKKNIEAEHWKWAQYECDATTRKCEWINPGWGSSWWTDPGSETKQNTEIREDPWTPDTPQTPNPEWNEECDSFVKMAQWVTINGWIATWANATSWWHWDFSWECYTKIQFYGRLNNADSNTYIFYWAQDWLVSWRTGYSINNNDLYRFTLKANWEYTIERAEATEWWYFDYYVVESWTFVAPEPSPTVPPMHAWVFWGAQIWWLVIWDNVWTPTIIIPVADQLAWQQEWPYDFSNNRIYWETHTNLWTEGVTETFLWYEDVWNNIPSSWIYYKDWELIVPYNTILSFKDSDDAYLPNSAYWEHRWYLIDVKFEIVSTAEYPNYSYLYVLFWALLENQDPGASMTYYDWIAEEMYAEVWDKYRVQIEVYTDTMQWTNISSYATLYKMNGNWEWVRVRRVDNLNLPIWGSYYSPTYYPVFRAFVRYWDDENYIKMTYARIWLYHSY